MNEITITSAGLPTTIDDLNKFVLIGREKLVAVRAEIRAIDKVGLAQEVRQQKHAEVKIGELMQAIPKAKENQYTKMQIDSAVEKQKTKSEIIKDAGFTQKQAERFQTLAANPQIIFKYTRTKV